MKSTLFSIACGGLLGWISMSLYISTTHNVVVHPSAESVAKYEAFLGIDEPDNNNLKTAISFSILNEIGRQRGENVVTDDLKVAEFIQQHKLDPAAVEAAVNEHFKDK